MHQPISFPCNVLTVVQLLGARSWKMPVLALLAINTAIAMKQTDGFLSTKLVDPTYSTFPGRMDTTIAGGSQTRAPLHVACFALCGAQRTRGVALSDDLEPERAAVQILRNTNAVVGFWQSALSDGLCCNYEDLW